MKWEEVTMEETMKIWMNTVLKMMPMTTSMDNSSIKVFPFIFSQFSKRPLPPTIIQLLRDLRTLELLLNEMLFSIK